MAVMIGSARQNEYGTYDIGKPGNQTGKEVATQTFYVSSKGWYIIRAKDRALGDKLGSLMFTACNNPNIGYSQNDRYSILKYGVHTQIPCNCDCSSLVRDCVKEASGIDPGGFSTSDEVTQLSKTGLFQTAFGYVSPDKTPLFVGDILVTKRKGHTVIVVATDGQSASTSYVNQYATGLDDNATSSTQFTEFTDYKARTEAPKTSIVYKYQVTKTKDKKTNKVTEKKKKIFDLEKMDIFYIKANSATDDTGMSVGFSPFDTLTNAHYAWNRFSEILNENCKIGLGLPGSWYLHKEDGYTRGMAATLGSMMCFSKPGTPGYVAIVEAIDPEGSVMTSEVDLNNRFITKVRTKRYGSWDFDGYKFQGFIQNPAVGMLGVAESALETMCRIAEEQVGGDSSWTLGHVDLTPNNSWCAAFITACSAVAGSSLNIVIPNTVSCSAIAKVGVLRHMGEFLRGPAQNSHANPKIGDIVLFRTHIYSKTDIYACDKAGLVTEVLGNSFACIIGDDGKKVRRRTYNSSESTISGYFRPKWDLIDGTTDSVNQYRNIEGLYTDGVSIEDACAREVCYLSPQMKPSINHSKIKLSAVNYTGLLANMYSVFAQSSLSDSAQAELVVDFWTNTIRSYYQTTGVDFESSPLINEAMAKANGIVSNIAETATGIILSEVLGYTGAKVDTTGSPRIAYNYLTSRGLTSAAACGILGNIKAESHFNTAAQGDNKTSYGICQWHNNRAIEMVKYVGKNWETNLTGQLGFMLYELQNKKDYASSWSTICKGPNTLAGAKEVANKFVRNFERPAHVDAEAIARQKNAADFWASLV